MGKNLLVLFIFALVFSILAQFLVDDFRPILLAFPALTMLILGVLPILIEAGIAILLAKYNIKIKI
ncbi:MAG: hypothetical protein ACTSV5_14970 [Promethearchaeota archaeon]